MNQHLFKTTLAAILLGASAVALAQGEAGTVVRNENDCIVAPSATLTGVPVVDLAAQVQKKNDQARAARERRYAMEAPNNSSWPNAGLGRVGGSMPNPGITAPGG